MAAMLAVGVVLGFVAVRNTDRTTQGDTVPGITTVPAAPSTTDPGDSITLEPATPDTPSTTVAVPVTAPPSTSSPGWCTASDLQVSASSISTSYGPGETVDLYTAVTDVVPCTFEAQASAGQPCADSIAVDQAGNEVWPWPGQGEQCSPPAPTVLERGDRETLAAAWNQQVRTTSGGNGQAPPGHYEAVGTWSWLTGDGQAPYQEQATATFSIS